MFNFIKRLFQSKAVQTQQPMRSTNEISFGTPTSTFLSHDSDAGQSVENLAPSRPLPLADVIVERSEYVDFDPECCKKLLARLGSMGAKTISEAEGLVVQLEDYFVGNNSEGSLAANCNPDPPYQSIQARFGLLKSIRQRADVSFVGVEIRYIETHEDNRIDDWPYSDSIWIYSSVDQEEMESFVAPLCPDAVYNANSGTNEYLVTPPFPSTHPHKPYWIWWD